MRKVEGTQSIRGDLDRFVVLLKVLLIGQYEPTEEI